MQRAARTRNASVVSYGGGARRRLAIGNGAGLPLVVLAIAWMLFVVHWAASFADHSIVLQLAG